MPLYTFEKFAEQAAHTGVVTVPALRFQYANRERNGLSGAFVKFEPKGAGSTGKGRVYVDPDRYWELLRAQQAGRRAA